MNAQQLTPDVAQAFARLALGHVEREYPHKLDHVLNDLDDVRSPRSLHALFYGSFNWHSCVHGYWLLATVLRRHPQLAEAEQIRALFNRQFTVAHVAAEVTYLEQPLRAAFERTYGWAWLLMLSAELARHESTEARLWGTALKPLANAFVTRFTAFLPRATYPIRAGAHANSAFAIALALDYADALHDKRFGRLLRGRAVAWYSHDANCQAWEPSGDDCLSSALMEAECMRRALDADLFAAWLARFLPRIAERDPATLFTPAAVSDRADGKIAHHDGLNLSRAWCWRSIAQSLRDDDPRRALALDTAMVHLNASLPHVAGDYAGEHWLASFALLALLA